MDYEQEEFFELIEDVEANGGELLEDTCDTRKYTWAGNKLRSQMIAGCGNQTLFRILYPALDKRGKEAGTHPLVVCAVDDDMGRWPRFGGDRYAKEVVK